MEQLSFLDHAGIPRGVYIDFPAQGGTATLPALLAPDIGWVKYCRTEGLPTPFFSTTQKIQVIVELNSKYMYDATRSAVGSQLRDPGQFGSLTGLY